MRKIEQEMLQAIREGRNWSSGNTSVQNDRDGLTVRLHGHRIGFIPPGHGRNLAKFVPNVTTLKAWPTATTISRLRALGVDAYRHDNYVWIGDAMIAPARGGRPR